MRPPVDAPRIRELARGLSRVARQRVRVYLTGGATAVMEGWRESTIDVDVRFEPELDELMRELPALKERLAINIEFASPLGLLPFLSLVLTYNPGAAFSFLASASGWQRWFFITVALAASVLITYLIFKHRRDAFLCLLADMAHRNQYCQSYWSLASN